MFAIIKNGSVCKDQKVILNEQWKFYENLYTSDDRVKFSLVNNYGVAITKEQKEFLDCNPTLEEIFNAANSMKCNKVPGCNGLTLEFYLNFFEELKISLWNMYNDVKMKGILGLSTRKGVISLLPKKDKDPRYLKNLRPLTLLNLDYKILAKTLATKLKKVLPDIIGPQQTGFMEGRNIQSNIRNTIDIITHIYHSGKRAVIVSIDFEKCFDHIEHNSIYEAMRLFNIGENFISWSKLFFMQLLVCTQNVGQTSEFFHKQRGVNQGCNLSPFCANLCTELLALEIKNNPKIKGITIRDSLKHEVTHTILQFADDTALFLSFSEECLQAAFDTLSCVEMSTGLKVSYDKSTVYRVGSLKNSNAKLYTAKALNWSDEDIRILGIDVSNSPVQSCKSFNVTIDKMENIMNLWHNRTLTLMGKVLLINSLMQSLFTYKMAVLLSLSEAQLRRINTVIINFLWKGKKPKIPIHLLHNWKWSGGLKLSDFKLRQKSLHGSKSSQQTLILKLWQITSRDTKQYKHLGMQLEL